MEATKPAANPLRYCLVNRPRMEGPHELVDRYELDFLDISDLDRCMRELAADRARAGERSGYNKLFGELAWRDEQGEGSIDFRIDVDAHMSEGSSLAAVMRGRVRFYESDKGIKFCEQYGDTSAADRVALYNRALAAINTAN